MKHITQIVRPINYFVSPKYCSKLPSNLFFPLNWLPIEHNVYVLWLEAIGSFITSSIHFTVKTIVDENQQVIYRSEVHIAAVIEDHICQNDWAY